MTGKTDKSPQLHMYQVSIIQFINKEHEFFQLSERINWNEIEQDQGRNHCLAPKFTRNRSTLYEYS